MEGKLKKSFFQNHSSSADFYNGNFLLFADRFSLDSIRKPHNFPQRIKRKVFSALLMMEDRRSLYRRDFHKLCGVISIRSCPRFTTRFIRCLVKPSLRPNFVIHVSRLLTKAERVASVCLSLSDLTDRSIDLKLMPESERDVKFPIKAESDLRILLHLAGLQRASVTSKFRRRWRTGYRNFNIVLSFMSLLGKLSHLFLILCEWRKMNLLDSKKWSYVKITLYVFRWFPAQTRLEGTGYFYYFQIFLKKINYLIKNCVYILLYFLSNDIVILFSYDRTIIIHYNIILYIGIYQIFSQRIRLRIILLSYIILRCDNIIFYLFEYSLHELHLTSRME